MLIFFLSANNGHPGLDQCIDQSCSDYCKGKIQKSHEYEIFRVPLPFKREGGHEFSSFSFGNKVRYLYDTEKTRKPYPIIEKAMPHSCHDGK